MESTFQTSSLSSRSHVRTDLPPTPSPVAVPHLSFRHRRRTKQRTTTDAIPTSPASPIPPTSTKSTYPQTHTKSSFRPWHRIRTRMSTADKTSRPNSSSLSAPSPTSTAMSSLTANAQQYEKLAMPSDDGNITPTLSSATRTPTSSSNNDPLIALKNGNRPSETETRDNSKPHRMYTNSSAAKKRPLRRLVPPTRSVFMDKTSASVTNFLRPALVPVGYSPESVDPSFKPHRHLLRKITLDDFDLNRYLFAYKPLARVNAVLAATFLNISACDQKSCAMSAALRSAIMYIVGNSHRSLYVMTYAAQLKCSARSQPAAEGVLPAMVLEGKGLSDVEVAALDYVQELSSMAAAVSDTTREKIIQEGELNDGKLERVVTGTSAYGAFLSCLTSTIDIELTHSSIQYATLHLEPLPWKASGSPVNVDFVNDDITDFGSGNGKPVSSKYKPKRERLSLTRNYDRHARAKQGSRMRPRGIRFVSNFFSSALGSKVSTDVGKTTESWMKAAGVPGSGNLFDMNDDIFTLYGFHPFYFSTAAMENEITRRALLFGVKELLFKETDVPLRLKFIICYVLSSGKERRRIVDPENSRSFEKRGIHNGHSINSVYAERKYDALSIMSAHAAFLACKYGARPAELVAATDASRVRSAIERYVAQGDKPAFSTHGLNFPLSQKDCAAVLIAHSLVKESARISENDLSTFANSFNMRHNRDGELKGQSALMEIIGAGSMWSCLERYAVGTLGFDIDCTSNMVFGMGRAESTISNFCLTNDGKRIGLSLGANENRDKARSGSDDNTPRGTAKQANNNAGNLKKGSKKRTSSALSSSSRVGRLFGSSGSNGSSALRCDAIAVA